MISLKAGGVGLNLIAADTVIHVDPWWNPPVEEQATSRAHRIGQEQAVFVYKLVVEGSIEERILELQARKAALAEGALTSRFDADDLRNLLTLLGCADSVAVKLSASLCRLAYAPCSAKNSTKQLTGNLKNGSDRIAGEVDRALHDGGGTAVENAFNNIGKHVHGISDDICW